MATLEQFSSISTTSTVVRRPARDRDDAVVCPECGQPVSDSKGPQRVEDPDLAESDPVPGLDTLVVFGWRCSRHSYDVVLPGRVTGRDAPHMIDGWVGVRVKTADGVTRWVPTPAKELPDDFLALQGVEL